MSWPGGRPSDARPALVQGEETEARSSHVPAQGQARSAHRRDVAAESDGQVFRPWPRPPGSLRKDQSVHTPSPHPTLRPRAPGESRGRPRMMEAISRSTACTPARRCPTNMSRTCTACVPVMPSWCCTCSPTRGSSGSACPPRACWAPACSALATLPLSRWAEGSLALHRRGTKALGGQQLARAFLTLRKPADFGEGPWLPLGTLGTHWVPPTPRDTLGAPGTRWAQSVPALQQDEMQTAPCGYRRAKRVLHIMALNCPRPPGGHVLSWHRDGLGLRTSHARGHGRAGPASSVPRPAWSPGPTSAAWPVVTRAGQGGRGAGVPRRGRCGAVTSETAQRSFWSCFRAQPGSRRRPGRGHM